MPRIWLNTMVSESTLRSWVRVLALAPLGKPQQSRGGGITTRQRALSRRYIEALPTSLCRRSDPQPGK